MDKATRYNEGKIKWSLVHFKSLEVMVKVLMFGASKYAPDNWKKGMNKKEILDSMQRHLVALIDGEQFDNESNLPHIGHILCNAMFYSYYLLYPEKEIISDTKEIKDKEDPDVGKYPLTPIQSSTIRGYDISSRFVINAKLSNEPQEALLHFTGLFALSQQSTEPKENTSEFLVKSLLDRHENTFQTEFAINNLFVHNIVKFKDVGFLMAVSQLEYNWIKTLSLSKEENFYGKENKKTSD